MRIDQLLPSVAARDAVSNHAFALRRLMREQGIASEIYAGTIGPGLSEQVLPVGDFRPGDGYLIFHMSIGWAEGEGVWRQLPRERLMMIYHNITPPEFFHGLSSEHARVTAEGRRELNGMKDSFALVVADSGYNRDDLMHLGFVGVQVMPLLLDWERYDTPADSEVLNRFRDGRVNILFVGRLAPNKKQEDLIKLFYYYQRYFQQESRLILVGSPSVPAYAGMLESLARVLDLPDVYFAGSVSDNQLFAYYRAADVFVCLSEHEGFCVPLLESMYFGVPVIAYAAAAVPWTMDGAGILVKDKNLPLLAALLHRLQQDDAWRERIVAGQRRRLEFFSRRRLEEQFLHLLAGWTGGWQ